MDIGQKGLRRENSRRCPVPHFGQCLDVGAVFFFLNQSILEEQKVRNKERACIHSFNRTFKGLVL